MNPLILLHGALGADQQLHPLVVACEDAGRNVYTLNFSGHGGRAFSGNGFGIEVFAEDVLLLIRERGIEQADIFGYSMGGYVATWLACRQPQKVGNVTTLGTKFDWDTASAAKEVKKMNPEKIVEKVPAFARILQHRHQPTDWKELMNKTADMMLSLGEKPLLREEHFRTITQRVHVLLGDADDMADRSFSVQVAAWLPNGRFHLLAQTPHPIEKVSVPLLLSHLLPS
jgi:pimeloyl-ACP methyl ester carboxylesterase